MVSKTSCFNRTLFRKTVTGNWPLWVCYSIALVLLMPLGCFRADSVYLRTTSINTILIGGLFYTALYAMGAAVVGFRYLNRTNSSYMLHAFPVDRKTLYCSNVCAGLAMGLLPFLVIFWLSGAFSGLSFSLLTELCLSWCCMYLFFYGLAVFCMICTGHSVAAVVLYGFLNLGALGMEFLLRNLIFSLLYGVPEGEYLTEAFSPAVRILDAVTELNDSEALGAAFLRWYLPVLAPVGAALLLGSYFLYKLRHAETAGEIVAHKASRPIFKYLVTVVASLGLGEFFCILILGDVDTVNHPVIVALLLLSGAFLGFFGAEMLLKKSLRVFTGKRIAAYGIFSALLVAFLCCFYFDLFGVTTYVPEVNEIASAELSFRWGGTVPLRLTEEEDLNALCDLHRGLAEDRHCESFCAYRGTEEDGEYWATERDITFTYTLNNGKTVTRCYSVYVDSEAGDCYNNFLEDETLTEIWLQELFATADSITLDYWAAEDETEVPEDSEEALADGVPEAETVYAEYANLQLSTTLEGDNRDGLLEALLQEIAQGTVTAANGNYNGSGPVSVSFNDESAEYPVLLGELTIPEEAVGALCYLREIGVEFGDGE